MARTQMTTYAYQTLLDVEHARSDDASIIDIVRETQREATVLFDHGNGDRYHRTLSKRNTSERNALNVVRMYLAGELPRYA